MLFGKWLIKGWIISAGCCPLFLANSWAFGQSDDDCLMCHSDQGLTAKRQGRIISLFVDAGRLQRSVHGSFSCVDCHPGLNPSETPHARVIQPVDCQQCHDAGTYQKSVHGRPVTSPDGKTVRAAAAGCKDCHGIHEILSPKDSRSTANKAHVSQTCGSCHQSVASHYARSAHGIALEKAVKGAPSCVDCHGEHGVEPAASKDSPVSKTREARTCIRCHLDDPEIRQKTAPSAGFIAGYESSVHGVAITSGNEKAASCSDCHGAHDMKLAGDPTSTVNRWHVAQTCAKCHQDISKVYSESIHGTALQWGAREAPSCVDCHGEHQIFAHTDPRARVSPTNVSAQVCAACHSSVALNQKYGLPAERFQSFTDSYHGLAIRAGSTEVANCASCHGVHNIKPSSDPTSTISKANLVATCGSCHPGAGENFARGTVHVRMESKDDGILYWVRNIYIWLIVTIVGGMFLHNLLDFVKKSRIQLAIRKGNIPAPHRPVGEFIRMSLNERTQHWLLMSSFIVLVITGFMLRFPDAWWVRSIRQLSESAFELRGLLHRIAGMVMIATGVYHIGYLIFNQRGRKVFLDIIPRIQDVRDVWGMIRHNLGLSATKPEFHRFGYPEKAEYWALIWGIVVMAGTGFILWFDNFFLNLLTKLGWDVARAIHYYEAILATLSILVWHFYFVIFNPSVYPINPAWWTGKISAEQMEEEHPLEFAEFQAAEVRRDLQA